MLPARKCQGSPESVFCFGEVVRVNLGKAGLSDSALRFPA
jgi:hypothetical protein